MIQLSASKLNLFNECPKCFWLTNNKRVERPRGIVASIMSRMDRVVKEWYDRHRPTLPLEVQGQVEGSLFSDMEKLSRWRNWRSGLTCIVDNRVKIIGAIDDLLVQQGANQSLHIPFDVKTKGNEPKDDGSQYYQNQLDIYGLLLSSNGLPVADHGYLAYYYPHDLESFDMDKQVIGVNFKCRVFKLSVDPDRAKKVIIQAADCLAGNMPEASAGCEFCAYVETRK